METFNARGSEPCIKKRPDAGVSMPRQITKRKIQSVDFVQGLRVKRSPYGGLYATFKGDTVAESRFEIVNRAA